MIQTALNWLYDNLYNYMIPVCGLCVLRVVVSLLELGHMKRLRDKLEDSPSKPRYLKTVYGLGYTWAVKP